MTNIIDSIRAEYLRYKILAEEAIDQLSDVELSARGPNGGNSIAGICWHVSGNLRSRFTDFLTSDGEKSWRNREEEFQERTLSRAALLSNWNEGWDVLLATLDILAPEQLDRTVTIRGEALLVHEALHRSLAHLSYHVGQIVYLARVWRGNDWMFLSIPPGKSDAYNHEPGLERPIVHHAASSKRAAGK